MEGKGSKRVKTITDFFQKRAKTSEPDSSTQLGETVAHGDGAPATNPSASTDHSLAQLPQNDPKPGGVSPETLIPDLDVSQSEPKEPATVCDTKANDGTGSGDAVFQAPGNPTFCASDVDHGSHQFPCSSAAPSSVLHSETEVALSLDIGAHVGKVDHLSDFQKSKLLETPWTPDEKYKFPFSEHTKNNKLVKRYVGRQHLASHHWLALSDVHKGLYCKYCVLFAAKCVGRSNKIPGALVTVPLKSFAKLYGKDGALVTHEAHEYHKQALLMGKNFLLTYHSPQLEITNQVNAQRLAQAEENRARLRPIVETIVFCGRQNIPLRGHRDDGAMLDTTRNDPSAREGDTSDSLVANDGNFRALLRFRVASGDAVLDNHLKSAKANATYISKTVQNELIQCCGEEIASTISQRVNEAGCFAIIFDETTDASHREQMSISLRYLYRESIREDFIAFTDCYEAIEDSDGENGERRLTGKNLAAIAINGCAENGVDIKKCVGVGTDNCYVMASEVKGAVTEIQKVAPMAVRCPCLNHTLNNSLKKTNSVNACRSTTCKMKETIAFSRSSAKIFKVFHDTLGKALSGLCETRWQEQHDGVLQFKQNLPGICSSLEKISKWVHSPETASKAYSLLNSLCDSEFIVSTMILSDVLGTTRSLSKVLQSPTLDHESASNAVKDTLGVLEKKRESADSTFQALYQEASKLAEELNVELSPPRTAKRQTKRDNHPASSAEEFFRRSIYIPVLDGVVSDLKNRLSEEVLNSFDLRILLPSAMDRCGGLAGGRSNAGESHGDVSSKLKRLSEFYSDLLGPQAPQLASEYELWHERWRRVKQEGGKIPTDVLDVIQNCDPDMFPCIRQLLIVLATLPVSVATAERSFSTLRRLKTWLRTRMSEDRLNGLALLHIHRDIECNIDRVIDRFVKKRVRRLDFVI